MRYTIVGDNGFLFPRIPVICEAGNAIHVEFIGVPEGATAVFRCDEDGSAAYRDLVSGACEFDPSLMSGTVSVSVNMFDGSMREWKCDKILVQKAGTSNVVSACEGGFAEQLTVLRMEMEKQNKKVSEIKGRVAMLADRIETMLEGYDIT